MSAVVVIAETNGPLATPVESLDVANLNFGSTAAAELVPSSHPITAAADGHAFEKWIRFFVSDLGTSSQIDNLKVWVSNLGGGYRTGEGISTNLRTSGYVQATYPAGGPVATNSAVAAQVMPVAEPPTANLGISGTLAGALVAAPGYSDYAVLQLDVSELTPAGGLNSKTITFQWDEF